MEFIVSKFVKRTMSAGDPAKKHSVSYLWKVLIKFIIFTSKLKTKKMDIQATEEQFLNLKNFFSVNSYFPSCVVFIN